MHAQAKKLEEIRSEAHAELGMMPAVAMASLPPLPGMAQMPGRKAEDEVFTSSLFSASLLLSALPRRA